MLASFLLGIAAGLRSATPPAALAIASGARRPVLTPLLTVMAAGELIADKNNRFPRRDSPPGAIGRAISGALAGAAAARSSGRPLAGAALGLTGAIVATQLGVRARIALAERLGSDWPAALIEDAATLAITALAVTRR